MERSKDSKRKKSKYDDEDDNRRDKKSKRARSRSRSPQEGRDRVSSRKRRHSRSESPEKRPKEPKEEKDSNRPSQDVDVKKEAPVRKNKETDMLNTRTGGAYIPPARLRMMQAQITDKASVAYQRLAWEALKKSIHGHINKINVGNIGIIIKQLLRENIVRGRGLLCRSVIQAQAASPTFTNVYAALVAAVNSRFPNIGELLLKRLVIQFKRGFKRNDKAICISSASFIAHLVNQRVAHEILALELLTLLVESPTDDSVEVAIAFLKECGQKLTEVSSKGTNAIFEMLRNILHEGQLDKRVQYMIEVMFQIWKDGFKDHPAVVEELELVPEEEQFTHLLMLDDATDSQDILNVFKFDDKYEENEQKYKTLSKEILGSDADSDDEEGSGESGSEESDEEEAEETEEKKMMIIDNTETNLVALRRTIYLTINSSLDFEECAHKLMKMQLKPGQEVELCHMFLDCCAEQRTYEKFYGLLAQRFCNINRIYIEPFEEIFKDSYSTAHRLDTNRLRNVSKFFAHLLFTDSISWEALECVKLNEEDTTSSSRIYIKILFQELAEYMGLKKLNDRLKDPTLQGAFSGVFPRDNPKNTRFSINFFTSIGLGGLTDELREHLKQMPKSAPQPTEIKLDSSSDSSSSSSSDSSSDSDSSDSSSEDDSSKKKKKKSKKTKKGDKNKDAEKEADEPPAQKGQDAERWGHDGFYDTYGKDARRLEPRDARDDVFARPRDVRDKPNRNNDRSNEGSNGVARNDDREFRNRREDGRDNDRRPREYERGRNNNDDVRRPRDDDRRPRDDRISRDDDEDRRTRNEDRRPRNDGDRRPRDEERRPRDDNDRRPKDEERRPKDDDRRGRGDDRRERENERRPRDEDRREKENKRPREDERSSRDADRRERRAREDERSREDERTPREEERRPREDEKRSKDDERRRDGEKSRRDEDRPRKDDKSRRGEERTHREDERSGRHEVRSRKEDKRSKDSDDEPQKEKERRTKKSKDGERVKEKSKKDKKNKKKSKNESSDSDSDDDRKRKEKGRNKREDHSSSETSDSESSDSSEGDRKKGKSRDDGWDIRGSSIRRELTVGKSYWDR